MTKRKLILLLILFNLVPILPAEAQAPKKPAPLYIGINNGKSLSEGDLYTYEGGLQRKTNYGHNLIPIASPDGLNIAYGSVADFFIQIRQDGDNRAAPTNIWIQSVATGNATRIAMQPDKANYDDGQDLYILRSEPSWSPSGRQLAWVELLVSDADGKPVDKATEQLVVYDLDTKTSKVIRTDLPRHRFVDTFPVLSDVAWGVPGIAVLSHVFDPKLFPEIVSVFTPDGRLVSQTQPISDSGLNFSQMIWVQDGARYYVSAIAGDVYFDPVTGTNITEKLTDGMSLTPELYSTLAPNGISLYYGDKTVGEGNPVWLIAVNGQVKAEMASAGRYYYLSGIGISSDGKSAAYIVYPGQGTQGGLYIFRNNAKIRLNYSGVSGVAWGPVAWRLRRTSFAGG